MKLCKSLAIFLKDFLYQKNTIIREKTKDPVEFALQRTKSGKSNFGVIIEEKIAMTYQGLNYGEKKGEIVGSTRFKIREQLKKDYYDWLMACDNSNSSEIERLAKLYIKVF